MPVFEIDARFPDHRKLRRLPSKDRVAAAGLWSLAGAWSTARDPGFVPSAIIVKERWDSARLRLAGLLVEVGLWHEGDLKGEHGYLFHDWPDWRCGPTLDDDEDLDALSPEDRKRAKARDRKRRERERDAVSATAAVTPASVTVTRDSHAHVTRDVTRDTPLSSPPHPPISHPGLPFGETARAAAAAGAGARGPAREAPPSDLAQRCVQQFTPRGISRRDLHKLASIADEAVSDGATWSHVEHALIAWSARSDCTPGLLPSLITEAVKVAAGGTAGRPQPAARSTTDDRVAAVEALRNTGTDTPPAGLRAIQGGQP